MYTVPLMETSPNHRRVIEALIRRYPHAVIRGNCVAHRGLVNNVMIDNSGRGT